MKKLSLSLLLSAAAASSALATIIPERRGVPTKNANVTMQPISVTTEEKVGKDLIVEGPLLTFEPSEPAVKEPKTPAVQPEIKTVEKTPSVAVEVPVIEKTTTQIVKEAPVTAIPPVTTTVITPETKPAVVADIVGKVPVNIDVPPAPPAPTAPAATGAPGAVFLTKPVQTSPLAIEPVSEPEVIKPKKTKSPEEHEKAFQKGFEKIKERAQKRVEDIRAKLMTQYDDPQKRAEVLRKKEDNLIKRYNKSIEILSRKHTVAGVTPKDDVKTKFSEFFNEKIQEAIAKLR